MGEVKALPFTQGMATPIPGRCPLCDREAMRSVTFYALTTDRMIPKLHVEVCAGCSIISKGRGHE